MFSGRVELCVVVAALVIGADIAPVSAQVFPPPLRDSTAVFRWSSYVQLRYTNVEGAKDLYGLRRLKVMIGGNLTPKIQWYAQSLFKDGNDSPTDGRVYFQVAWLRFAFRKEIQLVVGQFKPPFGRERFTPDFLILTIDRSLVTDALTPDGPYQREITVLRGRRKEASKLMPRVHRIAALLKRWLLGTHQGAVAHQHLPYYLDEFTFRFNRRRSKSRGKLFFRLMQQAVTTPPATYDSMVKRSKPSTQPVGAS